GQGHRRPRPRQVQGHRPPDPAAAPRHQGPAPVQRHSLDLNDLALRRQALCPPPRHAYNAAGGPMLEPGTPAPDFEVQDHMGKTRRLSDFRGESVLLWFYPRADTPG